MPYASPKGEAQSIADSFNECSLALHSLDRSGLDHDITLMITDLEHLMDATHLNRPDIGGWRAKAEQFSLDQKFRVSHLIDELANWFKMANSSSGKT